MIYSCKGCVAPKRYPGCHAVCQEYLEQKAWHDERKAELDKERKIEQAILGDRGKKAYNAMKGYRHSKYRER